MVACLKARGRKAVTAGMEAEVELDEYLAEPVRAQPSLTLRT